MKRVHLLKVTMPLLLRYPQARGAWSGVGRKERGGGTGGIYRAFLPTQGGTISGACRNYKICNSSMCLKMASPFKGPAALLLGVQ